MRSCGTSLAPRIGAVESRRQPDCPREAPAVPDVRQRGLLRLAQLRALPDRARRRARRRRVHRGHRCGHHGRRAPTGTVWSCNWRCRWATPSVRSCALVDADGHAERRARWSRSSRPSAERSTSSPSWRAAVGEPRASGLRFAYRSKSARRRRGHRPSWRRDHARPRRGRPCPPGGDPGHPRGALPHPARPHPPRARPLRLAQPRRSLSRAGWTEFRSYFGDESVDYSAALDQHYARLDDGRWRDDHASFYASAHPWEDFAESWAQLMHVHDVVETGGVVGRRERTPPTPPTPRRGWRRRSRPAWPRTSWPARWACATSTRSPCPPASGTRSSTAGGWSTCPRLSSRLGVIDGGTRRPDGCRPVTVGRGAATTSARRHRRRASSARRSSTSPAPPGCRSPP